MPSTHIKMGIAVYVCNPGQLEAGYGDRRTMGPCGPVSLLYVAMKKTSCLKGRNDTSGCPLMSTHVTIWASMNTYNHTQREEIRREREEGRGRLKTVFSQIATTTRTSQNQVFF